MVDLLSLVDRDDDLVPEILPVDARLSFSALASVLIELFASANDIAPAKEVLPNTSYVLLEALDEAKSVEVSATDGERSITVVGPAVVRMSGTTLLPGKRMLDILRLVDKETVRVDVIGTTATVRAGRAVWTVQTPPVGYGLPIPEYSLDLQFWGVDKDDLLRGLEKILPAIARSTARQSLMQAELVKGVLTSCDGVRAHRVKLETLSPKMPKTTLPLRFIESAIKELRGTHHEEVFLWSDHSTVTIQIGKNRIHSQRLNFEYPSVNHLVIGPAMANEERLTLNRADLISAIKRVRINADPEYASIFLSVRQVAGEWKTLVKARDKTGNASQEELAAEYIGPATNKSIALNHRYLLEFLACTEGEEITLRLGESTKTKQAPLYYESERFTGSLQPMVPLTS